MLLAFFFLSFYHKCCRAVSLKVNFLLNSYQQKGEISRVYNPLAIVIGDNIDYDKHYQLETAPYVEAHEKTDNTMKRRIEPVIYLHPSGNDYGGGYFMKIDNGERVHRNIVVVMPMPVDNVHKWPNNKNTYYKV